MYIYKNRCIRRFIENSARNFSAVVGLQIRKNTKGDRTYINPEVIAGEVKFLDWPADKEPAQNTSNQTSSGQNKSDQNPAENSYNSNLPTEDNMKIDVPF